MAREETKAGLRIRLFGPVQIEVGGVPLRLKRHRGYALLAYLVLRGNRPVDRQIVAEELWPEEDADRARRSLRPVLSDLRQCLDAAGVDAAPWLNAEGATLSLSFERTEVDARRFDQAVLKARSQSKYTGREQDLQSAVRLCAGQLLCDGLADLWLQGERTRRFDQYLWALAELTRTAEERRDFHTAIGHLRAMLTVAPYLEDRLRKALQLLAQQEDYAAVFEVYRSTRDLLRREFRDDFSAETKTLYKTIIERARRSGELLHRRVAPSSRQPTTPLPEPAPPPEPPHRLIDRALELKEIERLLHTTRVVTITGAPGIGKSRLALELAQLLYVEFPDGVCWVGLRPLRDPTLVTDRIARALGVSGGTLPASPRRLADLLRSLHLLLVLDNIEHLTGACRKLVEVLAAQCPNVSILLTSRRSLGGGWRQSYPLKPLPPGGPSNRQHGKAPDGAALPAAVALFLERVRLHDPHFQPGPKELAEITDICHQLERIPLMIELAAAAMRVLGLAELHRIVFEPGSRLELADPTLRSEHRTLRHTIHLSVRLLEGPRVLLFRRLGIFTGSFSVEAVQAICLGGTRTRADTLDLIGALQDDSLVQRSSTSTLRFEMLEAIREYAYDRLAVNGEAGELSAAHFEYFLRLATDAISHFAGSRQGECLARLEEERDNFDVALDWSIEAAPQSGLQMAAQLWRFWEIRGDRQRGLGILQRLLQHPEVDRMAENYAEALHGAAVLALHLGAPDALALAQESAASWKLHSDPRRYAASILDLGRIAASVGRYDEAIACYREALEACETEGDRVGTAMALALLGFAAWDQGQPQMARECWELALPRWREFGETLWLASVLNALAQARWADGDESILEVAWHESQKIYRRLGDRGGMACVLDDRGSLALDRGELRKARRFYTASLKIRRSLGEEPRIAVSLNNVANVAFAAGQLDEAYTLYRESLVVRSGLGLKREMAHSLEGLARVAAGRGEAEEFMRLLRAAVSLRKEIGARLPQVPRFDRRTLRQSVAAVYDTIGRAHFVAVLRQHRSISWEGEVRRILFNRGS